MCLVSSCFLSRSYETELSIFLLIWLTVGCGGREVAVLEIVDIEARAVPVFSDLPSYQFAYHRL